MDETGKTTVQSHDSALDWSIDQYGGGLQKKIGSYVPTNCGRLRDTLLTQKKKLAARARSKIDPMVPSTLLSASGNVVGEVSGTWSFEVWMRWQNPTH